ncbi:DUF4157 domain-containing protein [Variovorax sp. J22P271]|uniref:eCIS core domain-containing protein n=1 Tax=Variovorax davisae TaxID=3053515 RepID=UPI002576481E|nr:DUF4157 domain-containing protein [Variovorax sp. J22P271]MDM0033711.1 DUF4157 domain-containing protein [Variovorax sp. J22P271]
MQTFAAKPKAHPDLSPAASMRLGRLPPKSAIDPPGSAFEREADRVSERVTRMADAELPAAAPLRASRIGSGVREPVEWPPIVRDVMQSPGRPLDAPTRAFVEPRFGHDFSHVRLHTDAQAADSARRMNARAYAAGAHLVFGAGQYAPATASGRQLLAHELTHCVQQEQGSSDATPVIQRQALSDAATPEALTLHAWDAGGPAYGLRNRIQALLDRAGATYTDYRDAIRAATPAERQFVLERRSMLADMKNALGFRELARCVELLGRRPPTFDELRRNRVVAEAIQSAWDASNVGSRDRVLQAHEEGGWVFLNLITGQLSIERAKAEGTNYIRVEPPPDVDDSVLVAIFHTHPDLGRPAPPSRPDLREDKRRGVPNLVVGNTGTKITEYQIRLSGPPARLHLASDTKIPGPSGGIAP